MNPTAAGQPASALTWQVSSGPVGALHKGTAHTDLSLEGIPTTSNYFVYLKTASGHIIRYSLTQDAYQVPSQTGTNEWTPAGIRDSGSRFTRNQGLPGGPSGFTQQFGAIVLIAVMDDRVHMDGNKATFLGRSPVEMFEDRSRATPRRGVHSPSRNSQNSVDVGYEISGAGGWIPLTGPERPQYIAFDDDRGNSYTIRFAHDGQTELFSGGSTRPIGFLDLHLGDVVEGDQPVTYFVGTTRHETGLVTSAVAVLATGTLEQATKGGYATLTTTRALTGESLGRG